MDTKKHKLSSIVIWKFRPFVTVSSENKGMSSNNSCTHYSTNLIPILVLKNINKIWSIFGSPVLSIDIQLNRISLVLFDIKVVSVHLTTDS